MFKYHFISYLMGICKQRQHFIILNTHQFVDIYLRLSKCLCPTVDRPMLFFNRAASSAQIPTRN